MKKFLSLGVILQAITGVMVAALIVACVVSAGRAYERREAARHVLFATEVSRGLFDAMQSLRLERGAVGLALVRPDVSDQPQIILAQFRDPAEKALDEAFATHGDYRETQAWGIDETFDVSNVPASVRAARAIVEKLERAA